MLQTITLFFGYLNFLCSKTNRATVRTTNFFYITISENPQVEQFHRGLPQSDGESAYRLQRLETDEPKLKLEHILADI